MKNNDTDTAVQSWRMDSGDCNRIPQVAQLFCLPSQQLTGK